MMIYKGGEAHEDEEEEEEKEQKQQQEEEEQKEGGGSDSYKRKQTAKEGMKQAACDHDVDVGETGRVMVVNLSYSVAESDLIRIFKPFGEIREACIYPIYLLLIYILYIIYCLHYIQILMSFFSLFTWQTL